MAVAHRSDLPSAYEQFEQMKGITLAGCWAHVRRKYVDALEENRTLATQAIHYIGKLYKIESDANDAGLTNEERKEKRADSSSGRSVVACRGSHKLLPTTVKETTRNKESFHFEAYTAIEISSHWRQLNLESRTDTNPITRDE